MDFTVNLSEYVVFHNKPPEEEGSCDSNTLWFSLPENSTYQEDVKKLACSVQPAETFTVDTKKSIEFYQNNSEYFIHKNEPIEIRLVGYSKHGNKYQPYYKPQVVLPSGHVVSMSYDVLMRALLTSGLSKSGVLPGKYIFMSLNKKLQPIQIGSGIYKAAMDLLNQKQKKSLPIRELRVGKIYTTASGNSALFLGYVNTETMIVDLPDGALSWCGRSEIENYDSNKPAQDFGVRFLKKKLVSLWCDIKIKTWDGREYSETELQKQFDKNLAKGRRYFFKCKKSYRYTQELSDVHIEVPDDVVMRVRNMFEKSLHSEVMLHRLQRSNRYVGYHTNMPTAKEPPDKVRHYDACFAAESAAECNMTLYGMGVVRSDTFKLFEPWETKKNKFKQAPVG